MWLAGFIRLAIFFVIAKYFKEIAFLIGILSFSSNLNFLLAVNDVGKSKSCYYFVSTDVKARIIRLYIFERKEKFHVKYIHFY